MKDPGRDQEGQGPPWQHADARILGQILAAQNLLFVLPDEARIAQFFSEALSKVPGVTSCIVCLGNLPTPAGARRPACDSCWPPAARQGEIAALSADYTCALAASEHLRSIRIGTPEHTFGFFIFQTDQSDSVEPYWPFLENLASYVALSLENRLQKLLLERARDELEDRVHRRTEELKQAAEEISQLNRELEQRVAERTAQLAAANQELEAFAYSVSHDLRAPLRHIDGFLELLEKRAAGSLDQRSRHYMDTIAGSARRMGQLIDDLLAFSRMGRNELSRRQVNLADLLREILQELEPETQGRAIRWNIACLPTVTGDPAMLRLALINLIANALKFTRGRAPAEISIGCQVSPTETIVFIRDNGVGFDMAYVAKLFGVFQRLHRSDEFEGTGIGLANVRRIIHRHGGRTWAESALGQGASFYFSLPHTAQEVNYDSAQTHPAG